MFVAYNLIELFFIYWIVMNYIQIGSGTDIVFLHGWGGSIDSFLPIARVLSHSFRSTLVDFHGFGQTAEPKEPMTVNDYAKAVSRLCKRLKIKSAVFIGHSFGGRVSLELAYQFAPLVEKLVLIDSAGIKPRRGFVYYFRIYLHKLLRKMKLKGLKGSKDYQNLSPVMKETLKNVVNYNQKPHLKHINVLSAIFWGIRDRQTPPYMARVFRRHLSNSALFYLNGGHFAYLEDKRKFLLVLNSFLS